MAPGSELNTDWFKHQNNVTDLNDATESGIYIVGLGILNSPISYGICVVFAIYSGNNIYIMQIVKCIYAEDCNLYIRTHNENSGWCNWKTVAFSDVK